MKGFFKPINPEKYKGNPTNIVYRSSWEMMYLSKLDKDKNVLKYSSEEIFIPYKSPIDGSIRRYFPDMWVKRKTPDGKIIEELIEIKPDKETIPPDKSRKKTKRYLKEVLTYAINSAKWISAEQYCKNKGYEWKILTEYDLGIKKKKK